MTHKENTKSLHPAQLEVYYDQIMDLQSPHYNVGGYVLLEGQMDKEKMLLAIQDVQEVYDIHRLSFDLDQDEPQYIFNDNHFDVDIKELDFSEAKDPFAAAKEWMTGRYNTAFSMEGSTFYEFAVLHLSPGQNILFCRYHHIITDAFGFTLVVNYVAEKYSNLLNGVEGEEIVYKQYEEDIEKANEYLYSKKYDKDKAYWLNKFETLPSPILIEKGQEDEAHRSNTLVYEISEERRAYYDAASKQLGTSIQNLTLAALQIYYGQLMADNCSSFGINVYKRRKEQWKALGAFAGIIPFKAEYDPNLTVAELLKQINSQLLKDYRHQNYPVNHLNRELKLMQNDQSQLFEICVNYLLLDFDVDFNGLKSSTFDLQSDFETFPLQLWWRDYGRHQNLQLRVDHILSYIKVEDAELLIERLFYIMDQLVDRLDQPLKDFNILSPKEEKQLLYDFNDTDFDFPKDKTVIDLFEERVAKTPEKIVAVFEDESLSFQELNDKANQLANYLCKKGVALEDSVSICLHRSLNMMIGLTGIIKSGGAYVPIDPEYPQDRVDYILENSASKFVICTQECADKFQGKENLEVIVIDTEWSMIAQELTSKPAVDIQPENLMYAIYTSGSTGKPKGVMNQYSGVVNYLLWLQKHYQLQSEDDVILQLTTYCFDVSVWELFWPLIAGIKVVFARPGGQKDNDYLKEAVDRYDITTIHFVPSMLEVFLQGVEPEECQTLRKVICSGEALTPSHVAECRKHLPNVQLINLYGPTEAAVDVTFWDVPAIDVPVDHVPIGKPLANTQLYVLSKQGHLCPVGVQGELHVGGIQVARGYINRPDLTEKSFIDNPFTPDSPTQMYKTGDLALWLPDGNVEFLGRIDNQVKIRGNRIELGEVEATIQGVEGVQQCVVLAQPDPSGHKRLVAYVVTEGVFDKGFIQDTLKAKLPEYMVPSIMMEMDEIPLMANGKANTKALPNPDASLLVSSEFIAPRNEVEKQIAQVWKDLLKVNQVGINDNFFELGGDSIITIQLIRRLKQIGYHLSPRDVFVNSTVVALATLIDGQSKTVTAEQGALSGPAALLPIQQAFFENENEDQNHYNQSLLLEVDKKVKAADLEESIKAIVAQHDTLRFVYQKVEGEWTQEYGTQEGKVYVEEVAATKSEEEATAITAICERYQADLNIEEGDLLRVVLINTPGEKNRLFIAIHHLAIDGVSWRILLDHLTTAIEAVQGGTKIDLGLKSNSYREWSANLESYAAGPKVSDQHNYWKKVIQESNSLPVETEADFSQQKDVEKYLVNLEKENTEFLLKQVNQSYQTKIDDVLLSALGKTLSDWSGQETLSLGFEGHGREDISDDSDLSNTVGWFTSLYPINLSIEKDASSADLIKSVKEQLRSVPEKGLSFGLLRHLHPSAEVRADLADFKQDVIFNYLGQIDNVLGDNPLFESADESVGKSRGDLYPFANKLVIDAFVTNGQLELTWSYSGKQYTAETIANIANNFIENLKVLISHCIAQESVAYTPSDYGLSTAISYEELDAFLNAKENGMVRKENIANMYPLSPVQEGMLFHGLYENKAGLYTEQFCFDFPEGVDETAFFSAWNYIVEGNDMLRTNFYYDQLSTPIQVVNKNVELPIQQLDYSDLSPQVLEDKLKKFTDKDFQTGFDFKSAPLMRLALIKMGENAYRMIWTFHHIILDGWSVSVIMGELLTTYETLLKGQSPAQRKPNSYVDHIEFINTVDKYEEEAFWGNYLKGFDQPTFLPFVKNEMNRNKGGETSKELSLEISDELTEKLKGFAKANHVTVNTMVQGIWSFLLSRYTGNKDTVFGVTVSGRSTALGNMEQGVGLYINTLALRAEVEEQASVVDWMNGIQQGHAAAREFQYTTLNKIQKIVGINGDLFDSILVFENYPLGELMTKDWALKVNNIQVKEQTNYPLTIVVTVGSKLKFNFSYNDTLLSEGYVEMIRGHFETVVDQIINQEKEHISDISILRAEETEMLQGFNETTTSYPDSKTVVDLFELQVEKTPNSIAVRYEEETITYVELNDRANQLAHHLTSQGLEEEAFVMLCLDRSIEMVVSLLAVMKAGGAYIPIDPLFPVDRIAHIIEDANAAHVISTKQYETIFAGTENVNLVLLDEAKEAIAAAPNWRPEVSRKANNLAYAIYTSGSTGLPKGVMIEHQSLVNFLTSMKDILGADADSSLLAVTTYSFDIAYLELYMPILVGGEVIIASSETAADSFALQKMIAQHEPTYLQATPATWKMLLNSGWENKEEVVIMSGGEAIKEELKDALTALSNQKVWNLYGPTETTIWSTVQELKYGKPVDIGGPIANTDIFIVNNLETVNHNSLVPVGVIGELCIGGDGLARGYVNKPELTAEKFIPNPFSYDPNSRIYRTGDLARWMPDGNIECLGRKDHQVKIRGYRIELGEIETILQQSPMVNHGVVHAKEDSNGNKRLIAYIIAEGNFDKVAIRTHLESKLPNYMIPSIMMELDEFPLTPNGKVDKKALPNPDVAALIAGEYVAPQSEAEIQLAEAWKKVLKVDRVGVNDNFFELGGDSIISIQLVRELKLLGYSFVPKYIFERPTIAGLLEELENATKPVLGEQEYLSGEAGLLPIQQWFFEGADENINAFSQSLLLEIDETIEHSTLEESVQAIIGHHDALRFCYQKENEQWRQFYGDNIGQVFVEDLTSVNASELQNEISKICERYEAKINIETGDLFKAVLIKTTEGKNRLFLSIHHLAVDGVSWRILLDHFGMAIQAIETKKPFGFGEKTSSYREWATVVEAYANSAKVSDQQKYWETVLKERTSIPVDRSADSVAQNTIKEHQVSLEEDLTQDLLKEVNQRFNTQIDDVLLSALAQTLHAWSGESTVSFGVEGHGRAAISKEIDLTNSVGWFTNLYPVNLQVDSNDSLSDLMKSVKEQLRSVPEKGLSYGLLRYLHSSEEVRQSLKASDPEMIFNYLGQMNQVAGEKAYFTLAENALGKSKGNRSQLEVDAYVVDNQLQLSWAYSSAHYEDETIADIAKQYIENLKQIISHCTSKKETDCTPSDYNLPATVNYKELDQFLNVVEDGKARKENISDVYRLSPMQEGILFHALYDTSSAAFTQQYVISFSEGVNSSVLQATWAHLFKNHDILRSGFFYDELSIPVQCVYEKVSASIEEIDFSAFTPEEQMAKVTALAKAEQEKGFDFKKAPLMRNTLIKLDEKNYKMVWTYHHILLDGWSTMSMMHELLHTYEGLVNGNTPLVREGDHYQRYIQYLDSKDIYQEEAFWKSYMNGFETPSLLPFVGNILERNKGKGTPNRVSLEVEESRMKQLEQYAKSNRVTVSTIIQGVWAYLLAQYTGSDDVVCGVAVSGRPSDLEGAEQGLGLYMNTLPLRTKVKKDGSLANLFSEIQDNNAKARAFQYTALSNIQNWIGLKGDFFDSILVIDNYPMGDLLSRDWLLKTSDIQITADNNFLLSLDVTIQENLKINFSYFEELLNTADVEMIKNHFEQVLNEVMAADKEMVSEINCLTVAERHELIHTFNEVDSPSAKNKNLLDLFAAQVNRTPGQVALVFGEKEWTYQELDEQSTRLGQHLQQTYDLEANDLIGIMMDHSAWSIISIWGILKAGAGYVPIDMEYPMERKAFIIEDTKIKALIIQSESMFDILDFQVNVFPVDIEFEEIAAASANQEVVVEPADVAYVIYTSGSTGQSKGVMVSHGNLVDYVLGLRNTIDIEACQSFALMSTMAADLGNTVIYGALLSGGALHMLPKSKLTDAAGLHQYFNANVIDCIKIVPSHWRALQWNETDLLPAKMIVFGGEALTIEIVKGIQETQPTLTIVNHYGPTETTIGKLLHRIDPEATYTEIPIGQVFSNSQTYVVNENGNLSPTGVPGELWIGGDGVAKGYLNQDDLTAEKFIDNPFTAEQSKVYRTGDLVKRSADGTILFLGRKDDQVKIRGFRIELGEIEAALQQSPQVDKGVVLAQDDGNGNKRLVAYIVPKDTYDKDAIVDYLKNQLPNYMIPDLMMELSELPLTSNGKIDRKALPNPEASSLINTDYSGPENEMQEQIVEIWQAVLKVKRVGIYDDFFELGGNSLVSILVVSRIMKLGYQISPRDIFEHPTVAGLTTAIAAQTEAQEAEPKKKTKAEYLSVTMSKDMGSKEFALRLMTKDKGKTSIFCVPGGLGESVPFYPLGKLLNGKHNLYAFHAHGIDNDVAPPETVEAIAANYIAEMQGVDPVGPYYLGGYSFGSRVVYEMAKQLKNNDFEVAMVTIFDAPVVNRSWSTSELISIEDYLMYIGNYAMNYLKEEFELTTADFEAKAEEEKIPMLMKYLNDKGLEISQRKIEGIINVGMTNAKANDLYIPRTHEKLDVPILLFKARDKEAEMNRHYDRMVFETPNYGWEELTTKEVYSYDVGGNHDTFLYLPNVEDIGTHLIFHMEQVHKLPHARNKNKNGKKHSNISGPKV